MPSPRDSRLFFAAPPTRHRRPTSTWLRCSRIAFYEAELLVSAFCADDVVCGCACLHRHTDERKSDTFVLGQPAAVAERRCRGHAARFAWSCEADNRHGFQLSG